MTLINAPRVTTLGIIALIILTTSSLILDLDVVERHEALANEYTMLNEEHAKLTEEHAKLTEDHAKLTQINLFNEELFNLTKASIREAPRNIVLASKYSFTYYYTWNLVRADQTIETLINQEAFLFTKWLRSEAKYWVPRVAVLD